MKIGKVIKNNFFIFICFVSFINSYINHSLYASNIIMSDDKNITFNKDFNNDGKIVITLDPGHGGDEYGTERNISFDKNSSALREKDINLYIAKNDLSSTFCDNNNISR